MCRSGREGIGGGEGRGGSGLLLNMIVGGEFMEEGVGRLLKWK